MACARFIAYSLCKAASFRAFRYPIGQKSRKPSRKHGHDGEQVSHEFLLRREGFTVDHHNLSMMPLAECLKVFLAKTHQPISMSKHEPSYRHAMAGTRDHETRSFACFSCISGEFQRNIALLPCLKAGEFCGGVLKRTPKVRVYERFFASSQGC
jgi:hypothetical protein